jgi:hypothetical protein
MRDDLQLQSVVDEFFERIEREKKKLDVERSSIANRRADYRKIEDLWILRMCTDWRIIHTQQEIDRKKQDFAGMWGNVPDTHIDLDLAPLDQLREIEFHLSQVKPHTIFAAREMLGVVTEIMVDAAIAKDAAIKIVSNVVQFLDRSNAHRRG